MELHTIEASINGIELTIGLFSVLFFNYYGFFLITLYASLYVLRCFSCVSLRP